MKRIVATIALTLFVLPFWGPFLGEGYVIDNWNMFSGYLHDYQQDAFQGGYNWDTHRKLKQQSNGLGCGAGGCSYSHHHMHNPDGSTSSLSGLR